MKPPTQPQAQLEFQALHISLCEQEGGQTYYGGGFKILDHGVELDEDLTFDHYLHTLKGLKDFHNRSKLVLADYVRQGKIKYGDIAVDTAMVSNAAAVTTPVMPTVGLSKEPENTSLRSCPHQIRQGEDSRKSLCTPGIPETCQDRD